MARTAPFPRIQLSSDDLQRGPWVYARHAKDPNESIADGSLVEVADLSNRFIGHALWNGSSDVRMRWLNRGRRSDLAQPAQFLERQIRRADRLRRDLLSIEGRSDTYRVVNAEGDDLPGLVIDRLGDALVCQYHALGFWKMRGLIEKALGQIYPGLAVAHQVPTAVRRREGFDPHDSETPPLPETWISENVLRYPVEPGAGHKTGWFCDQRENRLKVAALCHDRVVLDLCTNAGGFALQAARHGARGVHAVDLDEVVLERAERAAQANDLDVHFRHADAFDVLREFAAEESHRQPGVIVLDPHKLIPSKAAFEAGKQRYSDFNTLAFKALRPGGLLATFSCSGSLDLSGFLGILFASARRAECSIRLLEVLGAGPDHPQRPDFARSRYLKGALIALDDGKRRPGR